MKKITLIITAILLTILLTAVIAIENKSQSPLNRYLETTRESDKSDYIPKEIINNLNNIRYEILSYELIDDKNIEKQTKYKAEYFIEGKVPPSDYIVKWTDFDAMARDYPKFDESRKSNGEKGMNWDEQESFIREHEAEYTKDKHLKTKYLFFRCRITYIGGERKEEWLDNISVFAMRGNSIVGEGNFFCYFDHSQHIDGEERKNEYFVYRFDKVGDSIECILG